MNQEFSTPEHRRERPEREGIPDLPADQESLLVICARASVLPDDHVVEGSIQRPCDVCEEAVWIGPASQRLPEQGHRPRYVCHGCGFVEQNPARMN